MIWFNCWWRRCNEDNFDISGEGWCILDAVLAVEDVFGANKRDSDQESCLDCWVSLSWIILSCESTMCNENWLIPVNEDG